MCVYIGPNPGHLPGRGMKENRLSNFTTHPRGESAGPRARAAFVAVPPTLQAPKRGVQAPDNFAHTKGMP